MKIKVVREWLFLDLGICVNKEVVFFLCFVLFVEESIDYRMEDDVGVVEVNEEVLSVRLFFKEMGVDI